MKAYTVPVFYVCLLALLAGCSSKPEASYLPLAPPDTAGPQRPDTSAPAPGGRDSLLPAIDDSLVFFPLTEDYYARYSYSNHLDFWEDFWVGYGYEIKKHYLDGYALLEVTETIQEGRYLFFNLRMTFRIEKEYFYHLVHYTTNVNIYFKDTVTVDTTAVTENYEVSLDYLVAYRDSSLWYVDKIHDLERPEEGKMSLLMEDPNNTCGKINPRIFNFPGQKHFSYVLTSKEYSERFESYRYRVNSSPDYEFKENLSYEIDVNKNRGFSRVYYAGGGAHLSLKRVRFIKYILLEKRP